MSGGGVLVVGGGPAGSSLALRLVRAGVEVTVVDAATFPRSKPCGDCLSPGASPFLEELGLLDRLRSRAGRVGGWEMVSSRGTAATGLFGSGGRPAFDGARGTARARGTDGVSRTDGPHGPGGPDAAPPTVGLALPRRELDALLLEAASEAGAALHLGLRVFGLLRRGDRIVGVRARDREGEERELRARLVVGADGLRSAVARRLGGVERGGREKLALVGRFAGVAAATSPGVGARPRAAEAAAPLGEMRFGPDGCLGMAPVGRDRWNVTLVVPLSDAERVAEGRSRFFREKLEDHGVAARFASAEATEALEITGPFEVSPRRTTAPGALLVGDAAGYFDPLTGQGIHRALATARAAARAAVELLNERARRGGARPESPAETVIRDRYERELRRILGPGRRVQLLLDELAARPALMDRALGLLAARPGLADLLVDVTGDRLPPTALLDPRRLAVALLGADRPTSFTRSAGAPCIPTTRS